MSSDFFDKKPGNWSPEYSPEMVAFYTAQLDAAGKGAGVAGNYGQEVAKALGLTPDNAIPPVPPAKTSQTQKGKIVSRNTKPDYTLYDDTPGTAPVPEKDYSDPADMLPSAEYHRALMWAEMARTDVATAHMLLTTMDGKETLIREWRKRTDDAETRKKQEMRKRLEAARARFKELGLGSGEYRG